MGDFERDAIRPHCLAQVITEARQSGKIIDSNRFTSQLVAQQTWGGWIRNIGWKAVQSVGDSVLGHNPDSFTIPEVAETLMKKLIEKLKKAEPWLMQKNHKITELSSIEELEDEDNKVVFEYLCLKKLVAVVEVNDVKFMKIANDSSTEMVSFSDEDICIIKLRQTVAVLEKEIDDQENEIKNLGLKVKQLLKSDSRNSAKATLKRQKLLETKLQKKLDQKFNLEILLDEILNTHSNKTVIQSYRAGVVELRSKLKDLNAENIDEVLSDLNEVLEDGDQLSASISRNLQDESLDAEELEKELLELSKDESDLDLSKELQTSMSEEDKLLIKQLEELEVNELEPDISSIKEQKREA